MSQGGSLVYPYQGEKFALGNLSCRLQIKVDAYNENAKNKKYEEMGTIVSSLIMAGNGMEYRSEFSQAMVNLQFALEKRQNSRIIWELNVDSSYEHKDLEICRELVIRAIEVVGKSELSNRKIFIPLSNESKEQNIADILGMITEELEAGGLKEEKYQELLDDFAGLLKKWRELEVPKTRTQGSYELITGIIEACCKHKAYHTAVRLSGLLYAADRTKNKDYLPETMYLVGKVMYELGYMEVAKRCLMFADEDTDGECWKSGDEKYKDLLGQETKLELPEEIFEIQRQIDERVKSGEIKLYTPDEVDSYFDGELEIPIIDVKKQAKDRKKLGDKALKTYEKSAGGTKEERLQGIEKAFAVFTEAPEIYPEAVYLYIEKANIFSEAGDYSAACEELRKAYNCKDGKRDGKVLLGLAKALNSQGREKEAATYLFRTYILCGKDFIVEQAGEEMWKKVEEYL